MVHDCYNVLLVEDVPVLAKVTEQMLKKSVAHRYSLTLKTTLADTLAAAKVEEFDILLLDLNLPDSADLDTLSRVLEACPDVPVIVLTSTQSQQMGFEAIKLGAQDFLVKGEFNFLTLDRAIVYSIERHRLRRTIQQLAVMDELTGLYNRRGFNTLYADIIERVKGSEVRGYVCYFDLDHFKQINDTLGHAAGDHLLKALADCCRATLRKSDLPFRYGGDEFIVALPQTTLPQAEQVVQKLRQAFATINLFAAIPNLKTPPTLSIGVAELSDCANSSLESLLSAADHAVYQAKRAGRNCIYLSSPIRAA